MILIQYWEHEMFIIYNDNWPIKKKSGKENYYSIIVYLCTLLFSYCFFFYSLSFYNFLLSRMFSPFSLSNFINYLFFLFPFQSILFQVSIVFHFQFFFIEFKYQLSSSVFQFSDFQSLGNAMP